MVEFKQRKFFVKKSFKFNEDGIEFYSKDLDGEFSKFIHFNDIEPRKKCRIYTEKYPKLLQAGLIITALALVRALLASADDFKKAIIVSLIVMCLGISTLIAFYLIRIKYFLIELDDDAQLFVILDCPNKEKMEAFIDEVFSRRREFYRNQYFYINYDNNKETELGRMNWLKAESIISDSEYKVVAEEINEKLK